MYRLLSCLITAALLSGCAGIDTERLSETSTDLLARTGEVMRSIVSPAVSSAKPEPENASGRQPETSGPDRYRQEQQALFDQRYIDPLTHYLIEHAGDPDRADVLARVRQERDRRCGVIAEQFQKEPATDQTLARYNAGYAYSCPRQVAAFEDRVNAARASKAATTDTAPNADGKPQDATTPVISDQALSDCYLLTTIRNYSEAREACRAPAEKGDTRAQANMAIIAYAFETYDEALIWSRKAADRSGDAAFVLAQMYETGKGVDRDAAQADHWYRAAAEHGHKDARMALERLARSDS
ncbi:MAG: tetratricopeptide repeat protein [Pseudomonadota bacterium]|nr:tetratricopeptide repeat protein [Pseudomonadota bacterium]